MVAVFMLQRLFKLSDLIMQKHFPVVSQKHNRLSHRKKIKIIFARNFQTALVKQISKSGISHEVDSLRILNANNGSGSINNTIQQLAAPQRLHRLLHRDDIMNTDELRLRRITSCINSS